MSHPVVLPFWLFALILLFATVTFASHFLFPSVRWFFRKRMERAVARLNQRLTRPIQPFKLARRYDMIQRLVYDPQVTEAIVEHARSHGVPERVAFEKAQRYAREIVPSFSATAYFTIGTRLSRRLSRSLFTVRIGAFDRAALDRIDPDAAVIFVMNHRSNMDYVLVTWLVSRASALSYAVGEWARVWPLSAVIRSMGAYFIRRKDRGALYRRVLARYVQLATAGGVTQAFFPEGGLSLDGGIGAPKLGLLSYIVQDFRPGGRDVIFVPVGLNYDRVLEDKYLIKAGAQGVRRFRPPPSEILGVILRYLWRWLRGKRRVYGVASVGFGRPLSLAAMARDGTAPEVEAVARELMDRVRAVVPILAVPLVARALRAGARGVAGVEAAIDRDLADLVHRRVPLPRRSASQLTEEGLANLTARRLVSVQTTAGDTDALSLAEGADAVLAFYARSVAHHFSDPGTELAEDAASAAQ